MDILPLYSISRFFLATMSYSGISASTGLAIVCAPNRILPKIGPQYGSCLGGIAMHGGTCVILSV